MKHDLNQARIQPFLKEFKAAYSELGIGEFSIGLAFEAINDGPGKITSAFNRHLNEQLDRDNIKSLKLRAIHINRYYSDVYRLHRACENLTEVLKENNR